MYRQRAGCDHDRMTYTHGHHESVLRSHRWRTVENSAAYLRAAPRRRRTVLDVGCGPGTITARLRGRVAPGQRHRHRRVGRRDREAARRDATASRPTSSSAPPTSTRSTSPTTRSTSCTRTRCCNTCPIPSARCARCGACASPAASSPRATATTPRSPGIPHDPDARRLARDVRHGRTRQPRRARRRPVPAAWAHAAGFTDVAAERVGVVLRDARRPRVVGRLWADRITKSAIAEQATRSAPRPRPTSRRWPPPGAAGPPTPTAGSPSCTARSSAAP